MILISCILLDGVLETHGILSIDLLFYQALFEASNVRPKFVFKVLNIG